MSNTIRTEMESFKNVSHDIDVDELYDYLIKINNSMIAMKNTWQGAASEKFLNCMMEYLSQFEILYTNISHIQKIIEDYPDALRNIDEAYASKKVEIV